MPALLLSALLQGCSSSDDEPSAVTPPAAVAMPGEQIFKTNCKVCHAQGINGAPVVGNQKQWGPRAAQGIDTLVEHASNGFGLMPAKGGKTELTTEEIRQAIEYILAQIEQ